MMVIERVCRQGSDPAGDARRHAKLLVTCTRNYSMSSVQARTRLCLIQRDSKGVCAASPTKQAVAGKTIAKVVEGTGTATTGAVEHIDLEQVVLSSLTRGRNCMQTAFNMHYVLCCCHEPVLRQAARAPRRGRFDKMCGRMYIDAVLRQM